MSAWSLFPWRPKRRRRLPLHAAVEVGPEEPAQLPTPLAAPLLSGPVGARRRVAAGQHEPHDLAGRYGEIWGDMGRYGQHEPHDLAGRYGEIWGDMGRYGQHEPHDLAAAPVRRDEGEHPKLGVHLAVPLGSRRVGCQPARDADARLAARGDQLVEARVLPMGTCLGRVSDMTCPARVQLVEARALPLGKTHRARHAYSRLISADLG